MSREFESLYGDGVLDFIFGNCSRSYGFNLGQGTDFHAKRGTSGIRFKPIIYDS